MHGVASGIEGRRTIGVQGDTSKRTAMVHARRSTASAGISVDWRSVCGKANGCGASTYEVGDESQKIVADDGGRSGSSGITELTTANELCETWLARHGEEEGRENG
jgi:hypothetical protein